MGGPKGHFLRCGGSRLNRELQTGGHTYREGDTILVKDLEKSLVARIQHIRPDGLLTVEWFYSPDDPMLPGGKQAHHGQREVFMSRHTAPIEPDDIICKCTVHSPEEYMKLRRRGPHDYFTRCLFEHISGRFLWMDEVPLYCTCRTPYNPDRSMVHCGSCDSWYHHECLCLEPSALEGAGATFDCPSCAAASTADSNASNTMHSSA